MNVKSRKQKRVNEKLRVYYYQYMAVLQREHVETVVLLINLAQKEQALCSENM